MTLGRRGFGLVAGGALVAPHVARAADPLLVGATVPLTGPGAEAGRFMMNGIRLALEDVNKQGVLGRQVEVVTEDDQTTEPGAVLAFSRLASRPEVAAFVGSIRSAQVVAMASEVAKAGKPMMFGGTDPTLTRGGNRWLFRCRPNDLYSAKVIAEYGTTRLRKRKWAVVASTDAFGTSGTRALEAELKAKGITPMLVQRYENQASDFSGIVQAVRRSGADVLGSYFTFEGDLGIFARQLRQSGVRIPWIGSPSIVNTTALNLAGSALHGTYGVADYAVDATPASRSFAERYKVAYNAAPDNQSSWSFDAVRILARAIGDAGDTKPEKVRDAILALRGYAGAEGEYNFDANGDGLHGYNVVRNDAGRVVFDRRVDFPA